MSISKSSEKERNLQKKISVDRAENEPSKVSRKWGSKVAVSGVISATIGFHTAEDKPFRV